MKQNDLTASHIIGTSQKTGFQIDTLEKTIRLYYVLKDISETPLLRDNLALKGGTAINLGFFNLPRLSVDIDMDFTRSGKMQDILPIRQEIKNTLFDLLNYQGYTVGKQGKEVHVLDQWTFNYHSFGGNNDHIKIDLNYGARSHIFPTENNNIKLDIVSDSGINIQTLHPYELFGSKINALIERAAVRDLFDINNLSKSNLFSSSYDKEMLKKSVIFYQSVGGGMTNEIDLSKITEVAPSKIKSQLVPLLPSGKKYFPIEEAKENTIQYLKSTLLLTPKECEFIDNFNNKIYKPDLLFQDSEIISRIADHPMAIWRTQQH